MKIEGGGRIRAGIVRDEYAAARPAVSISHLHQPKEWLVQWIRQKLVFSLLHDVL
jgi:hypothetical protein